MHLLLQNSIFYPRVVGGAEHSTLHLARELSARGHRVDVLTTTGKRGGDGERLHERQIEGVAGTIFEASSHGWVDLLDDDANLVRKGLHHFANVRSRRWERLTERVLEQTGAEVLHTNTIVGMTGSLWLGAARRGVPVVHTLRDYHLLCPRTTLLRSSGVECTQAPAPCRVYRHLKRPATSHVDLVTAPSRFVLERHLEYGDFPRARAEVVPNACLPPVDPAPERGEGPLVQGVFLGQIDRHKGIDVLLRTLTGLFESPDGAQLRFAFAGEGPMVDQVRSFCSAWSPRATHHGYLEGRALDKLLRSSDFLVFPSVWNEPFGRVILDAFRYALPVIGADRGGIAEVLRHGRNGLLIEPDPESLATAIRLYLADPARRIEHGRRGHQDVRAYGLDRQVERFLDLYQGLLGRGDDRPRPAALRHGAAG